tara:strand:+ start:69 stop:1832 length:1764 start_codon:yes stop_codon:yes gene_type:complete
MLKDQELLQICRSYEITCAFCATKNQFYRFKRDMVRPVKTEGDGHPLSWKWAKSGFEKIDPKQFFLSVCNNCGYTGEIDDAGFRKSGDAPEMYKKDFSSEAVMAFVRGSSTGKGIAQSLINSVNSEAPFGSAVSKFHLAVYSHTLRNRIIPGSIARYYLRLAWLFRDKNIFYADEPIENFVESLNKLRARWKHELPQHKDYPTAPTIVTDEISALRLSRSYFERNYETLSSAGVEDELRLRYLLAELGYRLYELTDDAADYKKAASFFSGLMQQCLGIISDKSLVGGIVNKSREMLEKSGERGRELRSLYQSRGGKNEIEDRGKAGKLRKKIKKKSKSSAVDSELKVQKISKKKVVKSDKNLSTAGNAETAPIGKNAVATDGKIPKQQISVLTDQIDTLKIRIKDAEADNKKWRELVGRDPLTGLPNQVAFVRANLPKIIGRLPTEGPFSCIAIGLDEIVKVNQAYGWLMGNKMLVESSKGLKQLLGGGEELYRLDGANFVLSGKMDSSIARQRAMEIRHALEDESVEIDKIPLPLVSSVGVVTVEKTNQSSALESAKAIHVALINALYGAKKNGGNTLEVDQKTEF